MAGIKRETMTDHEAQSETGGEDIVLQVRKADVAPKLTCMGCNGFFRGPVIYCQNKHGLCSICFGDKKECPTAGCGQKAFLTLDVISELVKDLKLPPPCKFKKDGCDKENDDEEVITEHEDECGFRKVECFVVCNNQPAMELEAHLFSAHDAIYGKHRDNPGKWFLNKYGSAKKMWIDAESGLRFMATLYHNDELEQWRCYTTVFGGKNVARKFRAEIRLSSNDVDSSLIFNCGVFCLDDWNKFDATRDFHVNDDQFKIYNKGHIKLGDHNKDKNGELMLPVTVEVKMKKLNVGQIILQVWWSISLEYTVLICQLTNSVGQNVFMFLSKVIFTRRQKCEQTHK